MDESSVVCGALVHLQDEEGEFTALVIDHEKRVTLVS
ncbi:MAG: hypothetical protein FD130_15 [Halothiobacillaceae bacterium]|nr:MAG: hypothetical protein FD130_15 [Halothiobacillaceae bacterium]